MLICEYLHVCESTNTSTSLQGIDTARGGNSSCPHAAVTRPSWRCNWHSGYDWREVVRAPERSASHGRTPQV